MGRIGVLGDWFNTGGGVDRLVGDSRDGCPGTPGSDS